MANTIDAVMIVVPRFGCAINRNAMYAVTTRTGRNVRLDDHSSRLANRSAQNRMTASLANSAGCRGIGPTANQRVAPLTVTPTPGISTSVSIVNARRRSGRVNRCHTR